MEKIDYNNNNSEKEDEKAKEAVGIEFTEQKVNPEMMKMLLTLDCRISHEKMRNTLLRLTWLRVYKNKLMKKCFPK